MFNPGATAVSVLDVDVELVPVPGVLGIEYITFSSLLKSKNHTSSPSTIFGFSLFFAFVVFVAV